MTSIPCCSPNNGAVLTLLTGLVNTLYDSYCNLADPRQYPTDIEPTFEYDYIIVSGSDAGCVLASRLTEQPDISVLILEEGGPPSATSSIPSLEYAVLSSCDVSSFKPKPTPGRCTGYKDGQCVLYQPKALGGISTMSNNFYLRGSHVDYNNWASLTQCDEYSYDKVLPFFKKSENYYLENKYHAKGGYLNINKITQTPDEINSKIEKSFSLLNYPKVDPNDIDTELGYTLADMFLKNGEKENIAQSFLNVAKHRENLYVSYRSKAKKLLYDKDCNRIYGVEYTKDGTTRKVRARKEVIVSSDTFSAPQLFMVSGFGPRDVLQAQNIEVLKEVPEMGQNLKYHVQVPAAVYSITNNTRLNTPELGTNEIFDFLTTKGGNLANINYKDNLAFGSTDGFNHPNFMVYFYLMKKQSTELSRAITKYQATDAVSKMAEFNKRYATLALYVNLLSSECNGHVSITSKNTDDLPDITSNILCSDKDKADVIKVCQLMKQFVETEPMKELGLVFESVAPDLVNAKEDEIYWREMIRLFALPNEETGTCSMGKVVDCDFKLYGVNGVRIIGSSVTPLNIAGNNNIANIMMAEKAAEKIING